MFLNCNYPNPCRIPKGKPKGITAKNTKYQIKKGKIILYVLANGNIYFAENGFYWGIEIDKFVKETIWGIEVFETIGAINRALLDWGQNCLNHQQEALLRLHLKTLPRTLHIKKEGKK